jgi:hypothetical protein
MLSAAWHQAASGMSSSDLSAAAHGIPGRLRGTGYDSALIGKHCRCQCVRKAALLQQASTSDAFPRVASQGGNPVKLSRPLAVASMFVMLGAAWPVHAALNPNALTNNALASNAITNNALTNNALAATGSAVADLNGVTVEAIALPQAARP